MTSRPVSSWSAVIGFVFAASSVAVGVEHDYPIQPVPLTKVHVDGGFWGSRFRTNREVTVPYDFRKCEETGRIDNFAVAGKLKEGGFRGIFFDDSDVFKVIEGASYCLSTQPDPVLDRYLDELIAKIAAAQEPDGYLYTARTIADPKYDFPGREARWSNLAAGHELYNVGHLYEAATAHFAATGKRNLLDVAIRNADLVCRDFGAGPGQRLDVCGHEEIELGLVKLYRATGDAKYLRQAQFFVDRRGRADGRRLFGSYCQDHQPLAEQREAVGHAVRAGYFYAAATDVAMLTRQENHLAALDQIWRDIVGTKMYLTGGVGARAQGEAFGAAYELPNDTAYNETCAAIAQAYFQHRLFLWRGRAEYIDVLERILYNGFLSGVSLTGDRFFYPNPLAANGRSKFNQGVLGRSPWFGCSCCPVNVVRFIPSIAGFVYAERDSDIYVNLFVQGSGTVERDGQTVTLRQETNYPWNGRVKLTIDLRRPARFALRVRRPGWLGPTPLPSDLYRYDEPLTAPISPRVDGESLGVVEPDAEGYLVIEREWRPGSVVEWEFPMPVRRVVSHSQVASNQGQSALERGPLVYCLEAVDNDGSLDDLVVSPDAIVIPSHRPDLLGGVTLLSGRASRLARRPEGTTIEQPATFTAVPYYAWAHRRMGAMRVWVPHEAGQARPKAAPTLASSSRPTASHIWRFDDASALNDLLEPQDSCDHDLPRLTWWDHVGTTEWAQYDFPTASQVSEIQVYWFEDEPIGGQCRVPASCRLLRRDGDGWKPVEAATPLGLAKNQFNVLKFSPVETTSLRLEVQLQPQFSAGILEWRVQ